MSTVFASRWKALWWCAGVLLTAYCTVPAPDEPIKTPSHGAGFASHSNPDDAEPFASDENLRKLQELRRKLP